MGYEAKIVLDSVSPDGIRLTTFEVTFPRIVLAEYNTHRMFSRNSASSRAIPVQKMIARVTEDPFLPVYWGKNQKGMQADQELSITEQQLCNSIWLSARDSMVSHVNQLLDVGVHKQIANRLLEPFMYHTVICTATEWDNFFNLRCHRDAQPEIRKIASMMKELYDSATPKSLGYGEWHLPYLQPNEFVLEEGSHEWDEPVGAECSLLSVEAAKKISSGRCARVSYLTHDGKRDVKADIDLCDRLVAGGHMSPLEHVARPMTRDELYMHQQTEVTLETGEVLRFRESEETARTVIRDPKITNVRTTHFLGNFNGWVQYRKEIPNESNVLGRV